MQLLLVIGIMQIGKYNNEFIGIVMVLWRHKTMAPYSFRQGWYNDNQTGVKISVPMNHYIITASAGFAEIPKEC